MDSWHLSRHLLSYYTLRIIFLLQLTHLSNPLSFNYPDFEHSAINLDEDASFLKGDILLTVDTKDRSNQYSVGRATNSQPLRLWDASSRNLTDFSTKFSFLVFSNQTNHGDGLAFFLADPKLALSKKIKAGGGLGLLDGDNMDSTNYSFFAVEFDTKANPWDPTGTHAGVNINSTISKKTVTWRTDISKMRVYNCSIRYNSSTHRLGVRFTGYRKSGRSTKHYLAYKVDLREILPEWVIFGFSAATGEYYEAHTLKSWSFSSSLQGGKNQAPPKADSPNPISNIPCPSPSPSPNHEKESKIGLLLGLGIGIAVAVGFLGSVAIVLRKWKRSEGKREESDFDLNMDDEFQKGIRPKRFCYYELERATNNFAEGEKLGQGGFGGVYRGFLKDLNSYVAIKRISRDSKQGIKEYATEVKIISQLRHRNLVQLIGWCHKKKNLLLIYEFMPKGSLDFHLYSNKSWFLAWPSRYDIVLGLASALFYLQEEWEQCVLHRDIKPSNIMLDSSFNAKLGDFGLARLVDHEKGSQNTLVAGTIGYMAPEYINTGKASKESDIYSFGIVVLEIASGRKPVDLNAGEGQVTIVEWIWGLYGLGKVLEAADTKLCGVFDEQQMELLAVVGLWCAHPDSSLRPSIRQVIQVLNLEVPLPILPQRMPVPTYLPLTMSAIFSSVSSLRVTR